MKYFKDYKNREDLFQVGCIGLINAYNNYDKNSNTKFSTYAYSYIFGEMKKLVREDKGVKISKNITKLYLSIEKGSIYLSQKLMRMPTIEEISNFLEIDEYLVCEALNSMNSLIDIDNIQVSDNEMNLFDELSSLDEDEYELINKRYMCDMTQKEVADTLGMSQVQVSRKEHKVLMKLRNQLIQ